MQVCFLSGARYFGDLMRTGKIKPSSVEALVLAYMADQHANDFETLSSSMKEETISGKDEDEAMINYGKLCRIHSWDPKNIENNEKAQDHKGRNTHTNIAIPRLLNLCSGTLG